MIYRYDAEEVWIEAWGENALRVRSTKVCSMPQEELLEVAREYKRRNLPIDLIVIDFFHWPKQGEWKFDPVYWPDPDAMVQELKEMALN